MTADVRARWHLMGWLVLVCAVSAGFTTALTFLARGWP